MNLSVIKDAVVSRFLERAALIGGGEEPLILENPTEEILEGQRNGKPVKMFARGLVRRAVQSRAIARLEENYLYSSRRFPSAVNNTIGAGALAVNTYPFFSIAQGGNGDAAGFPTGFTLSLNETNMELPGQIPSGQSFVFHQLGVSFNADASIADANALMEAATLQFSKSGGQFAMNHGPLKLWPGGTGNGGGSAATTVAATTLQTAANGSPDIRAVRNLKIARVIKAQEVFQYAMVIPRTTKATDGTAWALGNFVVVTLWLWGGWKSAIAA
jgi:hypothetical protein